VHCENPVESVRVGNQVTSAWKEQLGANCHRKSAAYYQGGYRKINVQQTDISMVG
jgi:hypothetical protein